MRGGGKGIEPLWGGELGTRAQLRAMGGQFPAEGLCCYGAGSCLSWCCGCSSAPAVGPVAVDPSRCQGADGVLVFPTNAPHSQHLALALSTSSLVQGALVLGFSDAVNPREGGGVRASSTMHRCHDNGGWRLPGCSSTILPASAWVPLEGSCMTLTTLYTRVCNEGWGEDGPYGLADEVALLSRCSWICSWCTSMCLA